MVSLFALRHRYAFRTEPCTDVEMNIRPHKIGIFVDYEKGEVKIIHKLFFIGNLIKPVMANGWIRYITVE